MSHQTLKAFEIYQNIHFIGIGGIGISALARILAKEGHQISGSDQSSNKNTDLLISENISLIIGHKAENIPPQTDLVIYTTAIPSNNPEIIEAEKRGLKSLTYPQAIGLLTKKYRSICIAGTHGKTTTTAMLGLMMEASGADPTIIVGSLIPEFGHKNDRLGNSPWLVLESCEYKDAFLNYFPEIVVLTCIDPEHLDYFGTPEKYLQAFKNFLDKIPPHGALIANIDDKNIQKILQGKDWNFPIITYGESPEADFKINNHKLILPSKEVLELNLQIPGHHNLMNASAALTALIHLQHSPNQGLESLKTFRGAARRFEIKGKLGRTTIVDDYAHTPMEIQATLQGAKEYFGANSKILVIFQPHQYSRTHYFLQEFGQSFEQADQVFIPNIYRTRDTEEDVAKVNVDKLVETINQHHTARASNTHNLPETLEKTLSIANQYNAIITIGAGDITTLSDQIIKTSQ
jgi:UDP-N-acetylmuramate--alanine ligase